MVGPLGPLFIGGGKLMNTHGGLLQVCFRASLINLVNFVVMGSKQLSPWNDVVSGTTAAILANAIVYPLDMYGCLDYLF
jgi:hypothetical protein